MQEPPTPINPSTLHGPRFARPSPAPPKPKLKKLRLAFVILGLTALALVSTFFGMLMAVARDLPSLENQAEFEAAENSVLYADDCKEPDAKKCTRIARLTGNLNRILVSEGEISPNIKNAVIAIEDRRFYSHEGVDYTGIARALWQDILRQSAVQGGSTITQQFVKNALAAQGNRSVFQKLRESALAYHLERKWSKEKILTQYLNTVYFGNGAYGVEAAVRTYFGEGDEPEELEGAEDTAGVTYQTDPTLEPPPDPDQRESSRVTPAQAALLAGMIASPTMYDPVESPQAAGERRNLVLARMLEQEMITPGQYEEALRTPVPDEDEVDPPDADSDQPYFTSWMTEHLLDLYSPGVVFGGGLDVKTTLDPELQAAAEDAIAGRLAGVGPSASLVAIENKTGEVKAMVGGTDFDARPFNLATNGHRQPGSAFKPFILVRALADGIDPNSSWASMPKELPFRGANGRELFEVANYEDSYLGTASLWSATATSDNSVFAELGMKVKPRRVARMARRMGIRTELSTNPAMLLGGLEQGVTPLEMAYAYSTLANDGNRVSGTLAPNETGPVAIETVEGGPGPDKVNERTEKRVFPAKVGQVAKDMLELVVSSGTGEAAQVGDEVIWGKTGTTENYGDAWFVGSDDRLTVAVWVGYADKVQPMEYEYAGSPVAGGTYPAVIFSDFMSTWMELVEARGLDKDEEDGEGELVPTPDTYITPSPELEAEPVAPEEAVPAEPVAPEEPAPAEPVVPEPTQPPAPAEPAPVEPAPVPETSAPESGGGVTPEGAGE
ncbi:MAG TPA: transglycosylase domain-containing protein [Thermoleophilaceae bacterium]|nr:transglycosylase domain-containing protein [Thermoleophilaceae bacterium]